MVSTVWFFFLLAVPPCPAICESDGTCPVLWSRRRWLHRFTTFRCHCLLTPYM